jgi:aryl-alcohol dehydrogenase-like predicted oxidoreductase
MFKTIDELRPIAETAGVSMATMAVQWVLANPAITSPIVGASRPEQLKDAVAAVDAPLAAAIKTQLDELTHEFRFGDNAR